MAETWVVVENTPPLRLYGPFGSSWQAAAWLDGELKGVGFRATVKQIRPARTKTGSE